MIYSWLLAVWMEGFPGLSYFRQTALLLCKCRSFTPCKLPGCGQFGEVSVVIRTDARETATSKKCPRAIYIEVNPLKCIASARIGHQVSQRQRCRKRTDGSWPLRSTSVGTPCPVRSSKTHGPATAIGGTSEVNWPCCILLADSSTLPQSCQAGNGRTMSKHRIKQEIESLVKILKNQDNLPEWVNGHHGKTARFFRFFFVQFTLQKIP